MAIRIQLRRDTAANWVSSNPVLRQGEMGIETDTLKMKLGNGSSTWTQITAYMNIVPDGNLTIGDYVLVTDIGAVDGVVGLNNSQNAINMGGMMSGFMDKVKGVVSEIKKRFDHPLPPPLLRGELEYLTLFDIEEYLIGYYELNKEEFNSLHQIIPSKKQDFWKIVYQGRITRIKNNQ
jgi:hypothetical protein